MTVAFWSVGELLPLAPDASSEFPCWGVSVREGLRVRLDQFGLDRLVPLK